MPMISSAAELTGRDGVSLSSVADVERLVQGVKLDIAGFHFDAGAAFLPAASLYVAAAKTGRRAARASCAAASTPIR